MSGGLPASLRAAVAESCEPVRPLGSPARRSAALLPLSVLVPTVVVTVWGLRPDRADVGPAMLWGASLIQIAVAFLIAWAALAESIPGRLPSRRTLALLGAAAIALVIGTTFVTFGVSRTFVPSARASRYFWICLTHPFVLGLPALLLLGIMASRGLTSRPVVSGALTVLGAGLISDASWRLYCYVSDPGHVLVAHAGAMAVLTTIGALGGVLRAKRQETKDEGQRTKDEGR